MTGREESLRAFCEGAAEAAPVIGFDDCGPWVARWIEKETGLVLSFPAYTGRDEGYAMAAAAGGLAALVAPLMAAIGLYETCAPQFGDVAVIALRERDTAGIVSHGGNVVIRGERRGVMFLNTRRIVKAWALPQCA